MTNQDALTQGILNYLGIDSSGALLLTGTWGCGKTYFIKNELFPTIERVKSGDSSIIPIMVSLYGIEDISELPKRIVTEYLDYSAKKEVHEAFHFGKIIEWGGKIAEACPKFNEWIDVSKLIGEGAALYRILPSNVVIFLDDLERAVDTPRSINNLLGSINELVENRHFKVIVVANKGHLDKLVHTEGEDKKNEEVVFYEKVIEKNLSFIPDMIGIFEKLVAENNDADFSAFMLQESVICTIDPTRAKGQLQKERMCNIRTLKFAINHMYRIFRSYKEGGADTTDESVLDQLINMWVFVHGISIELKRNRITHENHQGLDKYSPIVSIDIDLDDNTPNNLFEEDQTDELDSEKIDNSFAPNFYNHYYRDFGHHYIFYPQVYDFVLSGIDYDSTDLIAYASQENKRFERKVNVAQDIVDSLLRGFWQYTDEKTADNLTILLKAVEEGTLRDSATIYNASVYLLKFSYIIGKEEDEILASFKTGITKFMDIHSISPLDKQTFLMLPIERGSVCDQVYDMIASEMDRKLNEYQVENQKTLVTLFNTDVEQFVLQLIPNNRVSPSYASTPILYTIPEDVIAERVPSLQPSDLMNLDSMIRQRPSVLQGSLKTELVFFQSLQNELQKRKDEKTMSAFVIKEYVLKDNEKLINKFNN